MEYTVQEEVYSMQVLCNLAMEIQQMDETERLKTLARLVEKETVGKNKNNFWLWITKTLLTKQDIISQTLRTCFEDSTQFCYQLERRNHLREQEKTA